MGKTRLEYIDTLKFLAILGIVFIHVSAIWPHAEVLHLNIRSMTQIFRWGVPVFVMISGALLLNREIELGSFFKKRFIRVFYPLLFFTIATVIINGTYGVLASYLSSYWYCWMILGAYLAIPIINKFIQHSDDNEIKYYVGIFLVSALIYQIFFTYDINFALDINFFITPVSYLVLGYYLSTKQFKYSNCEGHLVYAFYTLCINVFLNLFPDLREKVLFYLFNPQSVMPLRTAELPLSHLSSPLFMESSL